MNAHLSLAEWRRHIFALYAEVRRESGKHPQNGWDRWRKERDRLFCDHAQSPLTEDQKRRFDSLLYFSYQQAYRVAGQVERVQFSELNIELPEGELRLNHFANVRFELEGMQASLGLYWLGGYGGGIFLPFTDVTCKNETYGGGRYLYDSIKGADLGQIGDRLLLDFNFAYNPSCAYNSRWVCPLAPPTNRLDFPILAGERRFLSAGLPSQ